MTATRKRDRGKTWPERYVPADGSTLTDERLGYLIEGYTADGDVAQPGERFYNAMWSRDRSGRCSHGEHQACAHRLGGPREAGVPMTTADGRLHVWRCGCDCHGPRVDDARLVDDVPVWGQLDLFGALA